MNLEIEIIKDKSSLRSENYEVERLSTHNDKAKQLVSWKAQYGGQESFKRVLPQFRVVSHPNFLRYYNADIYLVRAMRTLTIKEL